MTAVITIEQLKEGMELALPVKNKVGQMLLPANLIIEEKHKKLLQTWGILSVSIKGNLNEPEALNYDKETIEEAIAILEKRILWKPESPFEQELFDLGVSAILEKNT